MESVSLPENISNEQQQAQRAYQQQMLAAGARIQTADGSIITPKYVTDAVPSLRAVPKFEPDAEDERIIIDIDIPEVDDRTITLRSRKKVNGQIKESELDIDIPAPRMETAFMIGRYQSLIQKTYRKMEATEDDRTASGLNDKIIMYQKKLLRLLVPDIPDATVQALNMRSLNEIVRVVEGMTQEAMSASASPISYVRHIYRLMGEPNGLSDRGMMKWLQEHFKDIEDVYGELDLPKE